MIRSKLVVAVLFGALLALFAGSAAGAQGIYPGPTTPTTPTTGGTSPTTEPEIPSVTVIRGETVDVAGSGCEPGSTITVTYDDGTVLGTFTADANGDFVTTITIPLNSTLGDHLLTATCGDVEQYLNVNVLAEQVNRPGNVNNGALPRTGSETGPLLGIGAAALVLGGAFIYGARKPRNA